MGIGLSSVGRMRGCYLNSGYTKGDTVEMVLDLHSDKENVLLGFGVNGGKIRSQKISREEMQFNARLYIMKVLLDRGNIQLMDYVCLYHGHLNPSLSKKYAGQNKSTKRRPPVPLHYKC